jgi:hypothetical protein
MSYEDDIYTVASQVSENTSDIVVKAIVTQMARLEESKKRIEEEGIVVRDLKGAIVPHPALKVEQDTTKLISDLLWKHRQ